MNAEDLRLWVANQRAAEARIREEQQERGAQPEESIDGALGLAAVAARLHGWPMPEDAVSRREDEKLYDCWQRLRQRLLRA